MPGGEGMFVDTSGWGCLVDPTEPYHKRAADLYRAGRERMETAVTTNYVIAELVALMTSPLRLPRSAIIDTVEAIMKSPHVRVVHVDAVTDAEAWELLKSRPDKQWSLVDCASFVVMRRRGISEALTTDHHFKQAGLVPLLRA